MADEINKKEIPKEDIVQDPGNIMIIAFSYMGQRDHNLDIMEPDEAAAYVSKQMENNDNG